MSTVTSSHNEGYVQQVPAEAQVPLEHTLMSLVDGSRTPGGKADVEEPETQQGHADTIHTTNPVGATHWIRKLWPSGELVDKLFAHEHMGNYVIDRATGKRLFETMPLYVRVGMHLLFCDGRSFDTYKSVEHLLIVQSAKQGKLYDTEDSEVLPHIQSFIETYNLPLNELLVTDLKQYTTFNAFFSRRLTSTARPIDGQGDKRIICSPADCRLTVWNSIELAKKFWIKGKQFTIPELLGNDQRFKAVMEDSSSMLAIARLAPQDYHRFHSPVDGVVGEFKDIAGQLYTVNPQAVNEKLDVFTMNKRSVVLLRADLGVGMESVPMAFVAVGAMLVGSIGWSVKTGDRIVKGQELGWFQYGGSTTILVMPKTAGIKFDDDLVKNSESHLETIVKVGNRIASI